METPNKCSLPNQNRATSVKFDQFCFNNIAWKGMVVAHALVNFGRSQQGGLEERIINNVSLNFSSNYVTATTTDTSS